VFLEKENYKAAVKRKSKTKKIIVCTKQMLSVVSILLCGFMQN